ncbi:hypothetical protein BY996DRAFT_7139980 [Phakopsora pachyrhizi]|nr:hypothetical protein BY996DRAFT_7139980 [Phakopsora pachyrhizi]
MLLSHIICFLGILAAMVQLNLGALGEGEKNLAEGFLSTDGGSYNFLPESLELLVPSAPQLPPVKSFESISTLQPTQYEPSQSNLGTLTTLSSNYHNTAREARNHHSTYLNTKTPGSYKHPSKVAKMRNSRKQPIYTPNQGSIARLYSDFLSSGGEEHKHIFTQLDPMITNKSSGLSGAENLQLISLRQQLLNELNQYQFVGVPQPTAWHDYQHWNGFDKNYGSNLYEGYPSDTLSTSTECSSLTSNQEMPLLSRANVPHNYYNEDHDVSASSSPLSGIYHTPEDINNVDWRFDGISKENKIGKDDIYRRFDTHQLKDTEGYMRRKDHSYSFSLNKRKNHVGLFGGEDLKKEHIGLLMAEDLLGNLDTNPALNSHRIEETYRNINSHLNVHTRYNKSPFHEIETKDFINDPTKKTVSVKGPLGILNNENFDGFGADVISKIRSRTPLQQFPQVWEMKYPHPGQENLDFSKSQRDFNSDISKSKWMGNDIFWETRSAFDHLESSQKSYKQQKTQMKGVKRLRKPRKQKQLKNKIIKILEKTNPKQEQELFEVKEFPSLQSLRPSQGQKLDRGLNSKSVELEEKDENLQKSKKINGVDLKFSNKMFNKKSNLQLSGENFNKIQTVKTDDDNRFVSGQKKLDSQKEVKLLSDQKDGEIISDQIKLIPRPENDKSFKKSSEADEFSEIAIKYESKKPNEPIHDSRSNPESSYSNSETLMDEILNSDNVKNVPLVSFQNHNEIDVTNLEVKVKKVKNTEHFEHLENSKGVEVEKKSRKKGQSKIAEKLKKGKFLESKTDDIPSFSKYYADIIPSADNVLRRNKFAEGKNKAQVIEKLNSENTKIIELPEDKFHPIFHQDKLSSQNSLHMLHDEIQLPIKDENVLARTKKTQEISVEQNEKQPRINKNVLAKLHSTSESEINHVLDNKKAPESELPQSPFNYIENGSFDNQKDKKNILKLNDNSLSKITISTKQNLKDKPAQEAELLQSHSNSVQKDRIGDQKKKENLFKASTLKMQNVVDTLDKNTQKSELQKYPLRSEEKGRVHDQKEKPLNLELNNNSFIKASTSKKHNVKDKLDKKTQELELSQSPSSSMEKESVDDQQESPLNLELNNYTPFETPTSKKQIGEENLDKKTQESESPQPTSNSMSNHKAEDRKTSNLPPEVEKNKIVKTPTSSDSGRNHKPVEKKVLETEPSQDSSHLAQEYKLNFRNVLDLNLGTLKKLLPLLDRFFLTTETKTDLSKPEIKWTSKGEDELCVLLRKYGYLREPGPIQGMERYLWEISERFMELNEKYDKLSPSSFRASKFEYPKDFENRMNLIRNKAASSSEIDNQDLPNIKNVNFNAVKEDIQSKSFKKIMTELLGSNKTKRPTAYETNLGQFEILFKTESGNSKANGQEVIDKIGKLRKFLLTRSQDPELFQKTISEIEEKLGPHETKKRLCALDKICEQMLIRERLKQAYDEMRKPPLNVDLNFAALFFALRVSYEAPGFSDLNFLDYKLVQKLGSVDQWVGGAKLKVKNILGERELKERLELMESMVRRTELFDWWPEDMFIRAKVEGAHSPTIVNAGDLLRISRKIKKNPLKVYPGVSDLKIVWQELYAIMSTMRNGCEWGDSLEKRFLTDHFGEQQYDSRLSVFCYTFNVAQEKGFIKDEEILKLCNLDEFYVKGRKAWWKFGDVISWLNYGIDKRLIITCGENLSMKEFWKMGIETLNKELDIIFKIPAIIKLKTKKDDLKRVREWFVMSRTDMRVNEAAHRKNCDLYFFMFRSFKMHRLKRVKDNYLAGRPLKSRPPKMEGWNHDVLTEPSLSIED